VAIHGATIVRKLLKPMSTSVTCRLRSQKSKRESTYVSIIKQNKIPGFKYQNLSWPIIFTLQSSALKPTKNFANGWYW